jgi:hypothetical protein
LMAVVGMRLVVWVTRRSRCGCAMGFGVWMKNDWWVDSALRAFWLTFGADE